MALHKYPVADLRRRYGRYAQYGLLASLLLAIAAFVVPVSDDGASSPVLIGDVTPIDLTIIEPTVEAPPPPPPPAPPPPQEVPDEVVVVDVIADLMVDLDERALPPSQPPVSGEVQEPQPPDPPIPPTPPVLVDADSPDVVFVAVEQAPVLIGGLEGLARAIQYPEVARRINAEGTVYVEFVVDQQGRVTEPVVTRSPHQALSDEALRVVSAARFEPGQQRGRPVRVRYTLPVRFTLR